MDPQKLAPDLKDLRRRNRSLGGAVGGLVLCQLLSMFVIANLLGSERTVVVPPRIEKTFWVAGDKASASYLDEMGGFMAWLFLDVSPADIDWKKRVILDYVSPDQHGDMKTRLELEAERLRRINGSSTFRIQQFVSSERDQSVVLTGRLRKQINGQDVGEPETKSYRIQFRFKGSRLHLDTFKEIPHAQNAQPAFGLADGGVRPR